jgi:hypothetical protein
VFWSVRLDGALGGLHDDTPDEPVEPLTLVGDRMALRTDRNQRSSVSFLCVRRNVVDLSADANLMKESLRRRAEYAAIAELLPDGI